MSEEIIRYRIVADADDMIAAYGEIAAAAEKTDQEFASMARYSRQQAIAARDALLQAKVAALGTVESIQQEKLALQGYYREKILGAKEASAKAVQAAIEGMKAESAFRVASLEGALAKQQQVYGDLDRRLRRVKTDYYEAAQAAQAYDRAALLATRGALVHEGTPAGAAYAKAEAVATNKKIEAQMTADILGESIKRLEIITNEAAQELFVLEGKMQEAKALGSVEVKDVEIREKAKLATVIEELTMEKAARLEALQSQLAELALVDARSTALKNSQLMHANDLEKAAGRQVQALRSIGQTMQTVGQTASRTGLAMTFAVSAPIAYLVKQGIEYDNLRESARNSLEVVFNSGSKAAEVLARMEKFVRPTSIHFETAVAAAQRLANAGVQFAQINGFMERIAKLTALAQGAGKDPQAAVKELAESIAKLQSRNILNRFAINEISRFTNFRAALAEAYGMNPKSIEDTKKFDYNVGKKNISADTAIKILFDSIDKKAGNIVEKQAQTLTGLMANLHDAMRQSLGTIVKPLFEDLKSLITYLIPKVEAMAAWFEKLSPAGRHWVETIIVAAALAGPLLFVFGSIVSTIGSMTLAMAGFNAYLLASKGPANVLKGRVEGVGAEALAGAGGGAYQAFSKTVNGGLSAAGGAVGGFLKDIPGALTKGASAIMGVFKSAWTWLTDAIVAAELVFHNFGLVAENVSQWFAGGFIRALAAASDGLGAFVESISEIFPPALLVVAVIGGLVKSIYVYWDQLRAGWTAFVDFFVGYFQVAWPQIKKIASDILAGINAILQPLFDLVVAGFGEILRSTQAMWPDIKAAFTNGMNAVIGVVQFLVDGVKALWALMGENIIEIVRPAWEAVRDVIVAAVRIIMDVIGIFVAVLAGDWEKLWERVIDILVQAWNAVVSVIKNAGKIVGAAVLAVFEAWIKVIMWAMDHGYELIVKGINGVIDFLKSLPAIFYGLGAKMIAAFWQAVKDQSAGPEDDIGGWTAQMQQQTQDSKLEWAKRRDDARIEQQNMAHDAITWLQNKMHPQPPPKPLGGLEDKPVAGANRVTQRIDDASKAVADFTVEVERMERQTGLSLSRFSALWSQGMQQYITNINNGKEALKQLKAGVLSPEDTAAFASEVSVMNSSLGEMADLAHKIAMRGAQGFVGDLTNAQGEAAKKIDDFERSRVDKFKAGTKERAHAEQELGDYRVLVNRWVAAKDLEIFDKIYKTRVDLDRQIVDLQFQSTDNAAQHETIVRQRLLDDYREKMIQTYGIGEAFQQEVVDRVAAYTKAVQDQAGRDMVIRWRDINRTIEDATLQSGDDAQAQKLTAIARQVEDFQRRVHSQTVTAMQGTIAWWLEEGLVAQKTTEYELALKEAFFRDIEQKERDYQQKRKETRASLIFGAEERRQAENAIAQGKAFEDAWKNPTIVVTTWFERLAQAIQRANEAARDLNANQKTAADNGIRAGLGGSDVTKTAAQLSRIDEIVKKANPDGQKFLITWEMITQALGTSTPVIDNVGKIIGRLQKNLAGGVPGGKEGKGTKADLAMKMRQLADEAKKALKDFVSLDNLLPRVFDGIATAMGNALAGTESFGKGMIKAMGAMLAELAGMAGDFYIKEGLAKIAAGHFAIGAAEIAAGFGLKVLGAYFSAKAGGGGSSSSGASGSTAQTGASSQSQSANSQHVDQLPFNTSGQRDQRLYIDGNNLSKGMKMMFKDARVLTEEGDNRSQRRRRKP